ncbi:MAG: hypothetical protein IPL40_15975 [Proteobacteria bacterium]|nr:hypothetical protein [Pseudomonadota bacterium]
MNGVRQTQPFAQTVTAQAWVAEILDRPSAALPPLSTLRPRRGPCQLGDLVVFAKGRANAAGTKPGTLAPETNRRGARPAQSDSLREVGIVVGCSGLRAEFVFLCGRRLRLGRLDASDPHRRRDGQGVVVNSYVRLRRPSDEPGAAYLAGALLAGYATVEP